MEEECIPFASGYGPVSIKDMNIYKYIIVRADKLTHVFNLTDPNGDDFLINTISQDPY